MVTRDFDAYLAEKAGVRPTFKIAGQVFTLRSKMAYTKWSKLLASMRSDEVSPEEANDMFFRAALIRGDVDRFMALLNKDDDDDEGAIIGLQEADALVDWAMAHFTGKALNTSDGSSPGSNGTGPSPNVVSLQSKAPANVG